MKQFLLPLLASLLMLSLTIAAPADKNSPDQSSWKRGIMPSANAKGEASLHLSERSQVNPVNQHAIRAPVSFTDSTQSNTSPNFEDPFPYSPRSERTSFSTVSANTAPRRPTLADSRRPSHQLNNANTNQVLPLNLQSNEQTQGHAPQYGRPSFSHQSSSQTSVPRSNLANINENNDKAPFPIQGVHAIPRPSVSGPHSHGFSEDNAPVQHVRMLDCGDFWCVKCGKVFINTHKHF